MKSSSMSNHVTKFSQQVNFTNRPTHRTKNAHCYSDKRRINVSQSQHVFKCIYILIYIFQSKLFKVVFRYLNNHNNILNELFNFNSNISKQLQLFNI